MFELLLYSSMACPDADALVLRIQQHEHMEAEIKLELVETVKESVPECYWGCLLYTSPSPRDGLLSRMPSSA